MIFQLNCSIEELAESRKAELEEMFSRLLDADRSGRHYFISRRELCGWAGEHLNLSLRERTHLTSISEQYAERGGLVARAKASVSIVLGSNQVSRNEDGDFVIGHRALIDGEYLSNKASLIVENINSDGRFYDHVLREARKVSNIPSIGFDPIHGGGATTSQVYDLEIEKKRVVVCIVDNDRVAPMDRISGTAKLVLRSHRRRNCTVENRDEPYIGIAVTTIGREAENIIPYRLVRTIENYNGYRHFQRLERIFELEDQKEEAKFWQYFDLKEGIRGEELSRMSREGKISEDVIGWICQKLGCTREQLPHVSICGFGEGVLANFLQSPEALKGFHEFVRSGEWCNRFGRYFEDLLCYFAAPTSSRT